MKFKNPLFKSARPDEGHILEDTEDSPDADELDLDQPDSDSVDEAKKIAEQNGWEWQGVYNADEDGTLYRLVKDLGNGNRDYLTLTSKGPQVEWHFENTSVEGEGVDTLKNYLQQEDAPDEEYEPQEIHEGKEYTDAVTQRVKDNLEPMMADSFDEGGVDACDEVLRDLVNDEAFDADQDTRHFIYQSVYDEMLKPLEDDNRKEEYKSAAEGVVQIIQENLANGAEGYNESYVSDMAQSSQPKLNADILNDYVIRLMQKEGIPR